MRVAVIIHNDKGAQVLGITSDEVLRIGKQGTYSADFNGHKLTVIVDEHAPPINPPPLDLVV
jgi:hypothetical protein